MLLSRLLHLITHLIEAFAKPVWCKLASEMYASIQEYQRNLTRPWRLHIKIQPSPSCDVRLATGHYRLSRLRFRKMWYMWQNNNVKGASGHCNRSWMVFRSQSLLCPDPFASEQLFNYGKMFPQRATCTHYYIHYMCGHDLDAEFVKCPVHSRATKEELRCPTGVWKRMEGKYSGHRCRACLKSDTWCVICLETMIYTN